MDYISVRGGSFDCFKTRDGEVIKIVKQQAIQIEWRHAN